MSVVEVAGYSNPCGYIRGTGHTVAICLLASVYHVISTPFVSHLAYVRFSHGPCQVNDDMIVLRDLVKQEINALVGSTCPWNMTGTIQSGIHHNLIFIKMFLKSG